MSEEEEVSKLWRVRKTCCEVLRDRGYIVDDRDFDMDRDTFRTEFLAPSQAGSAVVGVVRDRMVILATQQDDPSKKIFVFFPDEGTDTRLGVSALKKYFTTMTDRDVRHAIFILRQKPSIHINRAFEEVSKDKGYRMEVFLERELVVNITHHVLVPQHIPLSEEDTKMLLERYRIEPGEATAKLPRMQLQDPVARYLGLSRGSVVKIIRRSESGGTYITYRVVF